VAAALPTLEPTALAGQRVVSVNRIDGAKYFREDGTWVMLRLSGTEPLIRVYAEGKSPEDVQALLEAARQQVVDVAEAGEQQRRAAQGM
jgi:phosphomannomutase